MNKLACFFLSSKIDFCLTATITVIFYSFVFWQCWGSNPGPHTCRKVLLHQTIQQFLAPRGRPEALSLSPLTFEHHLEFPE